MLLIVHDLILLTTKTYKEIGFVKCFIILRQKPPKDMPALCTADKPVQLDCKDVDKPTSVTLVSNA